jgi:hypothetical protein
MVRLRVRRAMGPGCHRKTNLLVRVTKLSRSRRWRTRFSGNAARKDRVMLNHSDKVVHIIGAVAIALGTLAPISDARAQSTPSQMSAKSSVLPTGGGAALLDANDTLFQWPTCGTTL